MRQLAHLERVLVQVPGHAAQVGQQRPLMHEGEVEGQVPAHSETRQ
jgi:hypothetical protein